MAKFARLQGAFLQRFQHHDCILHQPEGSSKIFSTFDNVLRINPRDSERHPLNARPKEVLLKLIPPKTVIRWLAVTATKEKAKYPARASLSISDSPFSPV
jgi:hypothetical protein